MEKSRGHVLFYSEPDGVNYELYRSDNGDLYTAPVSCVVDLKTKNRIGRWYCFARDFEKVKAVFSIVEIK